MREFSLIFSCSPQSASTTISFIANTGFSNREFSTLCFIAMILVDYSHILNFISTYSIIYDTQRFLILDFHRFILIGFPQIASNSFFFFGELVLALLDIRLQFFHFKLLILILF
jgi:hypothetical protein